VRLKSDISARACAGRNGIELSKCKGVSQASVKCCSSHLLAFPYQTLVSGGMNGQDNMRIHAAHLTTFGRALGVARSVGERRRLQSAAGWKVSRRYGDGTAGSWLSSAIMATSAATLAIFALFLSRCTLCCCTPGTHARLPAPFYRCYLPPAPLLLLFAICTSRLLRHGTAARLSWQNSVKPSLCLRLAARKPKEEQQQ